MEELCPTDMSRIKAVLIILVTLSIVITYHLQKELFRPRLEDIVVYKSAHDLGVRDPAVTCYFPMLHPFNQSILKYVSVSKPISCTSREPVVTYMDDTGVIRFNRTAAAEAGYRIESDFLCTYSEIMRDSNDFEVKYRPAIPLREGDRPLSDYVYVECSKKATGIKVYKNFHAYAQRNPYVRKFTNDKELGVVVVGIDSLSRLNLMRQLPKTYRLMKGRLGGTVLFGFNKVGLNTLPNVVPMLTGKPKPEPPYNKFKGWPFIWKKFEKEGAATMYSEDCPEINMFDYLENGIEEQPTLHYMRTFWLAVESSMMYRMSSTYCLGGLPKHLLFFDYLKSFLRTYRDSPLFLFSLLNELSHDYLNTVGAIDDDLVAFLNSSFKEGLFNRTVVFVLGDHGNRLDPIRGTAVGQIEDRMPLVSVILPQWVKSARPAWAESLRLNANRLTSTFDLYKTFSRILGTLKEDSNSVEDDEKLRFAEEEEETTVEYFRGEGPGVSLFRPVPLDRECSDAGIPDWFCVCSAGEEKLDPRDNRSAAAARTTVRFFNEVVLEGLRDSCEEYVLDGVESAVLKRSKNRPDRVEVRFRVEPGGGLFESLVSLAGGRYSVVGEAMRINRYGDQAKCLPHSLLLRSPILRGVCYCKG